MIYFRMGLILLYIRRLIHSSFSLQASRNTLRKSEVFFFTNGNHIQTPGPRGLIGDKYEFWLKEAESSGIEISHILNPFASIPNRKCQRTNFLIEGLLLFPLKNPVPEKELKDLFLLGRIKYSKRNRAIFRIYCVAISRYKPKVILGIALPPILCLAASLNSVKTVEFQHGIGYREEFDFQTVPQCSPDLMLMWHDVYSNAAREFGRGSLTVGFPLAHQSPGRCTRQIGIPLAGAGVLFTLSYLVQNSSDRFGYVHNEITEAIELLIRSVKKITLRLHPAIEADLELIPWRKFKYAEITETLKAKFPGVIIEFSSMKPLAQSLLENDLHISYKSSSIFEAAILGVPSILLSQDDKKLLLPMDVSTNELIRYSSVGNLVSDSQAMLHRPGKRIANTAYPKVISDLIYDWDSLEQY